MLNFCYLYSVIWGVVLVLYLLGWSDLCSDVRPEITLFFCITSLASLIAGYAFRDTFRVQKRQAKPFHSTFITIAIVSMCLLEYIICGQVPLVAIVLGSREYTSFTGIQTVHVLLNTFALFYSQHLIYCFACCPQKKSLLLEYLLIIFVAFFLAFNRGQLLINVFISLTIIVSLNKRKVKATHVLLIIIGGILLLYAFGCLGNMRYGYAWNDTSYFEELGRFNSSYPKWLPKQFMWAYIYLVSPMANLNYNVINYPYDINLTDFFASIIPDFISKRLVTINNIPLLKVAYFNVTSAFGEIYVRGRFPGMIIYWFLLIFGQALLLKLTWKDERFKVPMNGIMSAIVVFTFFVNTLAYSALSFSIAYCLIFAAFSRNRNDKEATDL